MSVDSEIEANLEQLRQHIDGAARRVSRAPSDITLVAVSKKQPLERVLAYERVCAARAEAVTLGENYVQEFRDKQPHLLKPYRAHLIGPLQRNKAQRAVELFDVIESVHSFEIAKAISQASQKIGKVQEIFLQVNVSQDPAKSGWSVADCKASFAALLALPSIKVAGLMTITWDYDQAEEARRDFIALRALRDELPVKGLKLSMGMSKDFQVAIEEGADFVRIGTALFGERNS